MTWERLAELFAEWERRCSIATLDASGRAPLLVLVIDADGRRRWRVFDA